MINSIMSMGKHILVGGGNSASNYINTGAGMMGVGDLRFNTSTQQIEFYNGQTWQIFTMAQATVGLTSTAETEERPALLPPEQRNPYADGRRRPRRAGKAG